MKSVALNLTFLTGVTLVAAAAFMVWLPLGLITIGVPLIAIPLHIQGKVKK